MKTKTTLSNGLIVLGLLLLAIGCKKDPKPVETGPTTPTYSFTGTTADELMFEDGEAMATMISENRRFNVSNVLRITAVNNTTIEVANFAPVDITDATILTTIAGQPQKIQLFHIATIKGHRVKQIPYPFITGQTEYLDVNQKTVDLSAYKTKGIAPADISFEFTGTTPLIEKLKKLSIIKWQPKMEDFDPQNLDNNWLDEPTAKQFRMFTGFMINFAYMYTDATMKSRIVNEYVIGNDGTTPLTTAEKEADWIKAQTRTKINCGLTDTRKVNGLGGGSTFGMPDWVTLNFMTNSYTTPFHEMGHVLGYNHSSSMTYPQNNRGNVPVFMARQNEMNAAGDFPVRLNNYYKPDDIPTPKASAAASLKANKLTEEGIQ
ncbi:hypothetical protein ACTJKC_04835 [Pedobacter sp. 22226]|uniref:hypothetical protein n=1 Tax=Pedobacter sp. 22226 TaxID=3453894 RepID=UPI003F851279